MMNKFIDDQFLKRGMNLHTKLRRQQISDDVEAQIIMRLSILDRSSEDNVV